MREPGEIGFITGLVAEARWLRNRGFSIGVGGGTPDGAADAAAALLDRGAQALVSFGVAGGLDPRLRPGALLVPAAIVMNSGRLPCDAGLLHWLGGPTVPALLAQDAIVATAAAKATLFAATDASAVDLESGVVAALAASRGVPFAALRAVADPAQNDLPPAALLALDAAGRIAFGSVFASLLARPGQLPALLVLARDAQRARSTLRQQLRRLPLDITVGKPLSAT